jgi:FlaG/FlaF family flagellin (archaellin)
MRRGTYRRDEEAVASSIGTMLAILVILALITMITTGWAPEWTKSKESEHLRVVEGQFANLKALMDQLSLSANTETVVSTPLTLGSEGFPLFSSDSQGTLSLLSTDSNDFNTFSITNSTGRYERVAYGAIVFESHNTEYVDQQFHYENGAIIISQGDGEVVVTGPALIIQNLTPGFKVSITLISIYSDGSSYTGVGTVGINCRLVQEKITTARTWTPTETVYINVTSSVYEAWYDYFLVTVPSQGVGSGDYDLSVDEATSTVHLTLRNVNQLVTDYAILGTTMDLT